MVAALDLEPHTSGTSGRNEHYAPCSLYEIEEDGPCPAMTVRSPHAPILRSDAPAWHDAAPLRGPRVGRRPFLGMMAAGVAGLLAGPQTALAAGVRPWAGTSPYQVGVGNSSDPYAATQRAVAASGAWPPVSLASRTVVIKPNLVIARPATTGATTDPQVVRALVDLALCSWRRQDSDCRGRHWPDAAVCGVRL